MWEIGITTKHRVGKKTNFVQLRYKNQIKTTEREGVKKKNKVKTKNKMNNENQQKQHHRFNQTVKHKTCVYV